mgnify:FL=1
METHSLRQTYLTRVGSLVALLAGLAIISSCAETGRWTRADYGFGHELPVQESDLADVSARIYLVSDNQRHELLGGRVDWYRNTASDEIVTQVAIRPPQLDMFGQDLLTEALMMTDGFVLHLGDACDLSNTGEFGRFAWDMRDVPNGWVMAPGNHDGYFYGNSSRSLDYLVREWNNTGETYTYDGTAVDSRAMQKDRYVSYYLAALILQNAAWSRSLAEHFGPVVQQRFEQWARLDDDTTTFADYWPELVAIQEEIHAAGNTSNDDQHATFELPENLVPAGEPHLRRLAWHIDGDKPWKSFVLQEVDISGPNQSSPTGQGGISIMVLDTANYSIKPMLEFALPSKLFNTVSDGYFDTQIAGETGGMPDLQTEVANEFAESMKAQQRQWLLASHHPFKVLGRDAKKRFNHLRDEGGIPLSLSAHTHKGGIRWNNDGAREGEWLEINVGSVLDAPIEYRDLQIHTAGGRHVVSSRRQSLEHLLRERGLVVDDYPGYRPGPEDPDFYLAYKEGKLDLASDANFMVKRVMLAAYLRMFRLFPTDVPDDGSTHWPTAPAAVQPGDHQAVTDAMQAFLDDAEKDDVEELTQFIYELREYDRTRGLTDAAREQRRVYRLSQAIWAGQAEYEAKEPDENTMDADLSWFVLPPQLNDAT